MNKYHLFTAFLFTSLVFFGCERIEPVNPNTQSKLSAKLKKPVKMLQASNEGKKMIKLETSMGDIKIELDANLAPVSVENFLEYVESGFYNQTIFHRVINDFMIQGGGFDQQLQQKPTKKPIINEAKNGLKNERGTIAMARSANPNSATTQFFINLKDNSFLNYPGQDGWGYAVFGKVIDGMEVVDQIAMVKTGNKGSHQNVPIENVIIEKITSIQ